MDNQLSTFSGRQWQLEQLVTSHTENYRRRRQTSGRSVSLFYSYWPDELNSYCRRSSLDVATRDRHAKSCCYPNRASALNAVTIRKTREDQKVACFCTGNVGIDYSSSALAYIVLQVAERRPSGSPVPLQVVYFLANGVAQLGYGVILAGWSGSRHPAPYPPPSRLDHRLIVNRHQTQDTNHHPMM